MVPQFFFNKSKLFPALVFIPAPASSQRVMPRSESEGMLRYPVSCPHLSLPEWSNLTFWEITFVGSLAAAGQAPQAKRRRPGAAGCCRHPIEAIREIKLDDLLVSSGPLCLNTSALTLSLYANVRCPSSSMSHPPRAASEQSSSASGRLISF